jgi:hypothetical protein
MWRAPVTYARFAVVWVPLTLGLLGLTGLFRHLQLPFEAGACGAAGILCAVGFPFWYRAWVRERVRLFAADLGVRGPTGLITLTLTEDALTWQTETVRFGARWEDMAGVEVVGGNTYINVTAWFVAVVPRRGFVSPEDYEAVQVFAIRKLASRNRSALVGRVGS